MWQKIAEQIWNFFLWLDRKHIKKFDYETAPYCGHHHCGHDGKYTETHYHEGDGGGNNKKLLWLISISYTNIDTCRYSLVIFPPLVRLYYWIITFHKRFKIVLRREKNRTNDKYRWYISFQYKQLYKSKYKFYYLICLRPFKVFNLESVKNTKRRK